MSTGRRLRKHSRVNHLLQHSRHVICCRHLGLHTARTVLPSGDSKSELKTRTYCPTTWSHCYQWTYAAQYADQLRQAKASPLLCKECTLLVRIQLSRKSQNHPGCAFADCASTTMCGAMISLTPCIAATVTRDCDLDASVSFTDETDTSSRSSMQSYRRTFRRFLNPGRIAMCSMPSRMSDTSKW